MTNTNSNRGKRMGVIGASLLALAGLVGCESTGTVYVLGYPVYSTEKPEDRRGSGSYDRFVETAQERTKLYKELGRDPGKAIGDTLDNPYNLP